MCLDVVYDVILNKDQGKNKVVFFHVLNQYITYAIAVSIMAGEQT